MQDKTLRRAAGREAKLDKMGPVVADFQEAAFTVGWSEQWERPANLEGHEVKAEQGLFAATLEVYLDGEWIGQVRTGRADPFAHGKGPMSWTCSDSHSGEKFPAPLNAADVLASRKLSGMPPPSCSDVLRRWAWENRNGGRVTRQEWMEIRGPYTPEHPWDEPVSENWPESRASTASGASGKRSRKGKAS